MRLFLDIPLPPLLRCAVVKPVPARAWSSRDVPTPGVRSPATCSFGSTTPASAAPTSTSGSGTAGPAAGLQAAGHHRPRVRRPDRAARREAAPRACSGRRPVTAEGHIVYGHCLPCRTGNAHLCLHPDHRGRRDGAFADYIAMPASNVMQLDGIPEIGAIMDPMGNAVHTGARRRRGARAAPCSSWVRPDRLLRGGSPRRRRLDGHRQRPEPPATRAREQMGATYRQPGPGRCLARIRSSPGDYGVDLVWR